MINVCVFGDDPCLKRDVFCSAGNTDSKKDQIELMVKLRGGIGSDFQEYPVVVFNAPEDMVMARTSIAMSNAVILVMNGTNMKPPFAKFRYYIEFIRENQMVPMLGDSCTLPVVLIVMNMDNPSDYEHRNQLNELLIEFQLTAKALFGKDQAVTNATKMKKSYEAAFESGRTHLTTAMMTRLMPMPQNHVTRCKSIRGSSKLTGKHVSQPALTSSADFRDMQDHLNATRAPSPELYQTCDSPTSDGPSPRDPWSAQPTPSPSPRLSFKGASPRKRFSSKKAQKSKSVDCVDNESSSCSLQ